MMSMNMQSMKMLKTIAVAALVTSFVAAPLTGFSAEKKKLKPYTLTTCVVSGDKLGEMAPPYVYEYKDREIKFCCKDCVKDFNKNPAKYLKKIEAAEKLAKKEAKK